MSFNVVATDGLAERGREILRAAPGLTLDVRDKVDAADLPALLAGAHALIVRSATKVTATVLEAAGSLRVVGRAGIGVDNVDVAAATRRGVVVMNTPHGNAVTTAEHAIALLLSLARHVPQATASVKAGKWERKKFEGTEVCEKTLGVVGLGNIGRLVAERARGLKMRVVGFDPFISAEAAARVGAELVSFDDLVARADFITVHTPLTPETRGLLGRDALANCRDGVLIVNAARGGIVDEDALAEAIQSGKVGGAALDVFVAEPPKDCRLLALDRVICTPHLGASTEEAQEKVGVEIAEQIVAFLVSGEVRNAVNLPPLASDLRERMTPWLDLATRIGAFASQLVEGGLEEIDVEATGDAAEGVRPIAACALEGLLRRFLDVPVNWVNAPTLAAERGIRVAEVGRASGADLRSTVALRARGRGWERSVVGSVLQMGGAPSPRIVDIDGFRVECVPEGCLVVLRNLDVPGVVGTMGTLLGQRGINISEVRLGRARAGGEALSVWNVDSEVPADLLGAFRGIAGVRAVTQVKL